MMVMFILFAVLYTYAQAERQIPEAFSEPPAPLEASRPEALLETSREAVRTAGLDQVEVVLREDESVVVRVQGESLFDLGRADLTGETTRFLEALAPIVRRAPYRVRIAGHTDSFPTHSGEFPTNWELSSARAVRVARHLIERGGGDPAKIDVAAHSMYRPVVPNSNEKNKARNRRVEITITREPFPGPGRSGAEVIP